MESLNRARFDAQTSRARTIDGELKRMQDEMAKEIEDGDPGRYYEMHQPEMQRCTDHVSLEGAEL